LRFCSAHRPRTTRRANLRSRSQYHDVKLCLSAEQIVKDIGELAKVQPLENRLDHVRVLLTAHQRIASAARRQHDRQSKTNA
jgi:hypothetical protein